MSDTVQPGVGREETQRKLQHAPRLSESVASVVRERIMSGALRSGEFIRVDALASELGVSATPVREALVVLRAEGFVELQQRRGFVVARLLRGDVDDIFMVHSYVSAELASRAAERMTPEVLGKLQVMHSDLSRLAGQGDSLEAKRLTHEFHREINLCADSPKLLWVIRSLGRFPDKFFESIGGWIEHSVRDHELLLEAFSSGDGEAARETTMVHFDHISARMVEHIEDKGLWGP